MSKLPSVTKTQHSELAAFEKFLQDELSNLPTNIQNLLRIPFARKYVDNFIEGIEDYIIPFMNESNGLVDGKSLSETISSVRPDLLNYISIPETDFRLVDVASELLTNAVELINGLFSIFGRN